MLVLLHSGPTPFGTRVPEIAGRLALAPTMSLGRECDGD
jgi:hypothetical protein